MMRKGPFLEITLPQTAFSLLLALLTGSAIIASFLYGKALAITIAGGFVALLFLAFSGNPRLFCLWGLILTAPLDLGKDFYILMPHMGGANSYPIELVDIFIVPLIVFLFRDFARGYRTGIRLSGVTFLFGGMILLGIYTMIVGPYRNLAGYEVFRMTKCLIVFLVILNETVRVKQFVQICSALAAMAFLQIIIGLLQYTFKISLGLQILGEASQEVTESAGAGAYLGGGEGVYRIGALLGHPNLLAAFLALLLPMMVALLFSRIGNRYKAILSLIIMLGSAAIFFTLSRSGWVAYGFALISLMGLSFIHPHLRRRYLMARINIIVLGMVVLLAFSGSIVRRLTESDPGALDFRYEWMAIAWEMIKDRPVLGFGLNAFVFNSALYVGLGGHEDLTERYGESSHWPVVHNIYLLTWAEQGTIGFLLFVGFHIYVLWVGLQNIIRSGNELLFTMNIGLITGFTAIMIDGMASFFIRNAPCGRIYWIVVGLIIAIYYWNNENRPILEQQ